MIPTHHGQLPALTEVVPLFLFELSELFQTICRLSLCVIVLDAEGHYRNCYCSTKPERQRYKGNRL